MRTANPSVMALIWSQMSRARSAGDAASMMVFSSASGEEPEATAGARVRLDVAVGENLEKLTENPGGFEIELLELGGAEDEIDRDAFHDLCLGLGGGGR